MGKGEGRGGEGQGPPPDVMSGYAYVQCHMFRLQFSLTLKFLSFFSYYTLVFIAICDLFSLIFILIIAYIKLHLFV